MEQAETVVGQPDMNTISCVPHQQSLNTPRGLRSSHRVISRRKNTRGKTDSPPEGTDHRNREAKQRNTRLPTSDTATDTQCVRLERSTMRETRTYLKWTLVEKPVELERTPTLREEVLCEVPGSGEPAAIAPSDDTTDPVDSAACYVNPIWPPSCCVSRANCERQKKLRTTRTGRLGLGSPKIARLGSRRSHNPTQTK